MDLGAVKTAATPELVRCAVGAAANARDLLNDAELLSAAARHARAYALAALAVEEAGKAATLGALAIRASVFLAHPPDEAAKVCWALLSAIAEEGCGRTPQAAANVWPDAIRKLRGQTEASDAGAQ